jgi:hypothetical protein
LSSFLEHNLEEWLITVRLDTRQNTWFKHDGSRTLFNDSARNYPPTDYIGRSVGRQGQVPRPSRSPDLNSLYYFLRGYANKCGGRCRGTAAAHSILLYLVSITWQCKVIGMAQARLLSCKTVFLVNRCVTS